MIFQAMTLDQIFFYLFKIILKVLIYLFNSASLFFTNSFYAERVTRQMFYINNGLQDKDKFS